MREKKYIKLRCDMYEDTKFKIIDTMEERDTINYIWTRILALCGKINNDEGALVISKDMKYTIEILALEFNRTYAQVENAINVFVDLNMMSKDEKGVYKVCNFNKHQGNKKKKEEISKLQNNKDNNYKLSDDEINLNEDKLEYTAKNEDGNKACNNKDTCFNDNKNSSKFKNKIFTFTEDFKNIDVDVEKINDKYDKKEELKKKAGGLAITKNYESISG